MKASNEKGFTLIELLVVIAIIGLLSSVIVATLSTARAKSRDARRISDIREIQKALELYADDHGGLYPTSASFADYTEDAGALGAKKYVTSRMTEWDTVFAPLIAAYMKTVPKDPLNDPWPYVYYYLPEGHVACTSSGVIDGMTRYTLVFSTEVSNFDLQQISAGQGGSQARYCMTP